MSTGTTCFLSYAREDKAIADRLYVRLRQNGIDVWMDKPPEPYTAEGIGPGATWESAIEGRLRGCRFFLPLFTDRAVEPGSFFERELKTALQIAAQDDAGDSFIVPILSGANAAPEVEAAGRSFGRYQWVDIVADGDHALVDHVQAHAGPGGATPLELEVATPEHLMDAIGPNRVIRLAPGDYDLTRVSDQARDHCSVEEEFDGNQLVFHHLENLELRCDAAEPAHLYVQPQYVFPLYLHRCDRVRIRNLRLGHSPERGECVGGVVKLDHCTEIAIQDCDLYGSGALGMEITESKHVTVLNTTIRDCTNSLLEVQDSEHVAFHGCTIRDNTVYGGIAVRSSRAVSFADCDIGSSTAHELVAGRGEAMALVVSERSYDVALTGCTIDLGPFTSISEVSGNVAVRDCLVTAEQPAPPS